MSTRGIIARPTEGEGFIGRYHHFDAYPAGLGMQLIDLINAWGVSNTTKTLIDDHPAGWSSIFGDWSQKPGFIEFNKQHRDEVRKRPQCYCHGDRQEQEQVFDNTDSGCEFAYVIDEDAKEMLIYETQHADGGHAMGMFGFPTGGNWNKVGKIPLTADLSKQKECITKLEEMLYPND